MWIILKIHKTNISGLNVKTFQPKMIFVPMKLVTKKLSQSCQKYFKPVNNRFSCLIYIFFKCQGPYRTFYCFVGLSEANFKGDALPVDHRWAQSAMDRWIDTYIGRSILLVSFSSMLSIHRLKVFYF